MMGLDLYVAEMIMDARVGEALHAAEERRLLRAARLVRRGWLFRQRCWLLCQLGHLLIALGQRLRDLGLPEPLSLEGELTGGS
jgi:hypothetical protein